MAQVLLGTLFAGRILGPCSTGVSSSGLYSAVWSYSRGLAILMKPAAAYIQVYSLPPQNHGNEVVVVVAMTASFWPTQRSL